MIKIIDFGTCIKFKENSKMKTWLGTAYYIAPEVLNEKYDQKCDIWSCGVILYILIFGKPPFNGSTDESIFSKIKKGKFEFPTTDVDKISPEVKKIIS